MLWILLLTFGILLESPPALVRPDSTAAGLSAPDSSGRVLARAVVFADDTLFYVYSPLGEFEVQERSTHIAERLRELARSKQKLDSLRLVENRGA